MSKNISKLKSFLFLILFSSLPVFADTGFKPIVIGVILIFLLILIIVAILIGLIHFYFTRKIISLELGYSKIFQYTLLSSIPGILTLVVIPKNNYSEGLFLLVVSISMFLIPILILFFQKWRKK